MAAESVGLAASVAGLVSLGLTITGGILKYIDAVENRQDELDSVRNNNEVLAVNLRVIEAWANSPGQILSLEAITATERSMKLVEIELRSVMAFHSELVDGDEQDWKAWLSNKKKKFTFVFSRSKVQELGQRLQKATDALHITLSALGLQVSRHQTDRMVAVETSTNALVSETRLVRSEIEAFQIPLAVIHDQLQKVLQLQQRQEEETARQHKELGNRLSGLPDQLQQRHVPIHVNRITACKLASELVQPLRTRAGTPVALRSHQSVMGRVCTCPLLQNVKERWGFRLGSASFSGEWETISHWSGCPVARTHANSKKRVTLGFKYNSFSRILQNAIHASFSWTSGAGGFSVSPSFICNPTVDDSLDPAFRIMGLLINVPGILSTRDLESFTAGCMRKLAKLFDNGKAYPTAVNIRNQSLMHLAIDAFRTAQLYKSISYEGSNLAILLIELIQMLLSYGVAAFTYNTRGKTPLAVMGAETWTFDQEPVQDLIEILIQANSERHPAVLDVSIMDVDIGAFTPPAMDVKRQYQISIDFAEACECGPLSLAVRNDDVKEVFRIIQCAPGMITEKDIYGQSPFHLVAFSSNPDILEVLLQSAGQRRSLLKQRDICGLSAFETAIMHSSQICTCDSDCTDDECTSCACIDLWLNTDCGVRMHKLPQNDDAPNLQCILSTASEAARQKYASLMKTRWTSTRRSVPSSSHTSPISNSRELEVVSESAGVERSSMLSRPQHNEVHSTTEISEDMGWIFNEISDPHLATLFYDHGFRPNLSCLTHLRQSYLSGHDEMNHAYLDWLVSHGVDLGVLLSNGPPVVEDSPNVGLCGAHFAFHFLRFDLNVNRDNNPDLKSTVPWAVSMDLLATVLRRNFTDGCSCHCTEKGCSPFTWMMKGEIYMRHNNRRLHLCGYIDKLESHFRRCGPNLTLLTYRAVIRYATFVGLNLVHTCCDAWHIARGGRWAQRNDVEFINEEQETLIDKLEKLVEFENRAIQYLDTQSNERGSFADFWSEYWIVRMEEEVNELEGANFSDTEREAERKAAEEIGVRWVDTEKNSKGGNPYDQWRDPKYWFYELNQISPEYSEPWPEGFSRISGLS